MDNENLIQDIFMILFGLFAVGSYIASLLAKPNKDDSPLKDTKS